MPSRHHLSFPSVCAPIPYVTSLTRWVRLTRAYPREVHTSGRAFARRGLTVVKSGARAGYAECNTVPETSWRNWTRTYWCGASAAAARGRWSEDPRPYEDDAWCRGSATGRGAIRSFRRAWITACRRAGLARVVERDAQVCGGVVRRSFSAPLLIGFHWFSLVHHRHSRAQKGHTTTHSFGLAVFGIDLARTTSLRLRTR